MEGMLYGRILVSARRSRTPVLLRQDMEFCPIVTFFDRRLLLLEDFGRAIGPREAFPRRAAATNARKR